jgi:osmotically-inducible protein OsmY
MMSKKIREKSRSGFVRAAMLAIAMASLLASPPMAAAEDAADQATLPIPDPCPDGKAVLPAQTPEDAALENRVEGALATAGLERMTKVEVAAIGGTVCLRGTAASPSDRQHAETTAEKVTGVASVVNRLVIPLAK